MFSSISYTSIYVLFVSPCLNYFKIKNFHKFYKNLFIHNNFCFQHFFFNSVCRRAYTASLGETAVAFDFGPLVTVSKNIFEQKDRDVVAYPLYILYENGETFLTYVSLLHR